MKNKKALAAAAAVLGIIFIVIAWMYFFTPANSLPSFFPGYSATLTTVHIKHGVASLVVGLVLFAFAWFTSGKKSAH